MTVTILLNDLTTGAITGEGIFDKLMASTKAHLEAEYAKGRIKGPEYATVYLGALDNVMSTALQFLMQKAAIGLQADLLEQQILLAQVEVIKANAQVALLQQQTANAVIEGTVLVAQECKLRAEYDLLLTSNTKAAAETALLAQKNVTEKAQTMALGVDDNSVIGKQKALYHAQTEGFARDAEQKTAKLLVDSWNVRRTTDEGTVADGVNMLNDATVGRAVNKVLSGVGA